jgi:adenylate cyclase, class 2
MSGVEMGKQNGNFGAITTSAVDTIAMPREAVTQRDVNAKFPLVDGETARARSEQAGFRSLGAGFQRDTYFAVRRGKLKLREESAGSRLIQYHGTGKGHYTILAIAEPAAMREMLDGALGIVGEVAKERTLLLRDNVRIHFDKLQGLGEFGEVEVLIDDEEQAGGAHAKLLEILKILGVHPGEILQASYLDLLLSRKTSVRP